MHKKDVQKAAAMLERKEEYACILAFDVRVDHEVELFAASEGVRIFSADIIYHLEDEFLRYRSALVCEVFFSFSHVLCSFRILSLVEQCLFKVVITFRLILGCQFRVVSLIKKGKSQKSFVIAS